MIPHAAPPLFDAAFLDQLNALIAWRRDVRHFRTEPLPDETVLALLETAQQAPSVGNAQPWRFVRVRSPSLRDSLADHVDSEAARAGTTYADGQHDAYAALKLHGLREAPEILAVFCDETTQAGHGLGAATMAETRAYSVVLAIYTLWLAARARGIGLGWVSILDPEFVERLLDVPPDWRLIALLCLGHPAEDSPIPELERRGWQGRLAWRGNISAR